MKRDKIIIGSRGSKLAMIYAEKVKNKLSVIFTKNIEIKKIITSGDENLYNNLNSYQAEVINSIFTDIGNIVLPTFFSLSSDDLITSLIENDFNQPSFSDYLSFDSSSDEFKAFYPALIISITLSNSS